MRSVLAGVGGALLLAALALAPGLPVPAAAVSAGYRSITTYTVDPEHRQVAVLVDLVPEAAAEVFSDPGSAKQASVRAEKVDLWVENTATDVHAAFGSTTLDWAPPDTPVLDPLGYHQISVDVPAYRAAALRRVKVTYTLPDGGIRSEASTRVLADAIHLCVHGSGQTDGEVDVVAPDRYRLDRAFSSLQPFSPSTDGDQLVLRSGVLPSPDTWSTCLYLIDPGQDRVAVISTGGGAVTLRSWPGDTEWESRVTAALQTSIPSLVTLIGRPLPNILGLTVREAFVPPGYEGQYGAAANEIALSEFLTTDTPADSGTTVAHELSHAWFNAKTELPVWLYEGSAEWAARSVVPDEPPCLTVPPGAGKQTLRTWTYLDPGYTPAQQQAAWDEYDTACNVVTLVARAAGPDGTRAALAALFDHRDPYGASQSSRTGAATWQAWLDAFDELGVYPQHGPDALAGSLLLRYGVTSDTATLQARLVARSAYHDLIGHTAPWTVPMAVRNPLSAWQFTQAQAAIATAKEAYDDVVQAGRLVPGSNTTSGPLRAEWQAAATPDDLDAVLAMARAQLDAARDVAAAIAPLQSPLGFVAWLGSLGSKSPTLAEAEAAVGAGNPAAAEAAAAHLRAELARYEVEGENRLALGSIVLFNLAVIVGLVVVSRVRRRPRRRLAALVSGPGAGPDGTAAPVASAPIRVMVHAGSRPVMPPPPPDWLIALRATGTLGPPPPPRLVSPQPLMPLLPPATTIPPVPPTPSGALAAPPPPVGRGGAPPA